MKPLLPFVFLLATSACAAFTPQQRAAGTQALQDAYTRGEITAQQRDDGIAALQGGKTDLTWLWGLGSVVASLVLGVPISVNRVQALRGPVATTAERVTRAAAAIQAQA